MYNGERRGVFCVLRVFCVFFHFVFVSADEIGETATDERIEEGGDWGRAGGGGEGEQESSEHHPRSRGGGDVSMHLRGVEEGWLMLEEAGEVSE